MSEIEFPIIKIEGNCFLLKIDMDLYAKEAVVAACYKFTDRFYVHQQTDGENIVVVFESKDGNAIMEEDVKQFCNKLIDQQVRYNTNLQFGHIRDLIVEEAFRPINK